MESPTKEHDGHILLTEQPVARTGTLPGDGSQGELSPEKMGSVAAKGK